MKTAKAVMGASVIVLILSGFALESPHAGMWFVIGLIAGAFGLIAGGLFHAEQKRREDIEFKRKLRREETKCGL